MGREKESRVRILRLVCFVEEEGEGYHICNGSSNCQLRVEMGLLSAIVLFLGLACIKK